MSLRPHCDIMSDSSFVGLRRSQVRITIPETSKIIDNHGKHHVVFTVQIRAPGLHRQVAKKFSEFRTFDTVWRSKYPSVAATLPPKVWLHNKSDKVIAERQIKLEAYLNALADVVSVIPYLAKFLGIPAEVLKPQLPPVPPDEPSVMHYRRRRNSGSAALGSNASSGSNLRTIGTRSTTSSVNLSDDLARRTPMKKSDTRAEETSRSELMRKAESMSGFEGVVDTNFMETARRTETSIKRPVSDFTKGATWTSQPAVNTTTPSTELAVTSYGSVAESSVDFHNVLLMALETVLSQPTAMSLTAGGGFLESDSDIGSLLDEDWDRAAATRPATVAGTDMLGVRMTAPGTYIL